MIRWITKKLGTAAYNSLPENIDAKIVDVRDLVDKPGNKSDLVREKISQALKFLHNGQTVVICCDYGMSRSNAVAAGVLSREQGISFSEAISKVMQATGEKEIKVEVLRVVRQALEGDTPKREPCARPRVLLTGGGGFIGRPLQQALTSVVDVFAPTSRSIDLLEDTVALDLYVKEHNISAVFHFAKPRVWNTNKALGDALVMLRNVLDVCKENGLKLIFPSHSEVFSGYKAEDVVISEETRLCPRGLYGETKFLCEVLISQYHTQYNLRYLMIRSPNVYGKSDVKPYFIHRFAKEALSGKDIVTHEYLNGPPNIELLYIDDYMAAVIKSVEFDLDGVLHLGCGQSATSKEIATEICKLLNVSVNIHSIAINDFTPNIRMGYERAKLEMNWLPNATLHEGLKELISLYQK